MDTENIDANNIFGLWITLVAMAAFICSFVGAIVARMKRRNQLFWLIACFVLPPLLLILLFLPPRSRRNRWQYREDGDDDGLDSYILPQQL